MGKERSSLIIPVENQVRELDGKLLLSCVAAERGFRVILGSRTPVHFEIASFPRGIYLAKSLRRLSERMFGIIRDLGHDIVAWDEEALVHLSDVSFYYGRRLSPKTMRQISALFAWGAENVELFRNYSGYSGVPIHVTGNVRADMMRPELLNYFAQEVEKIRNRFDRFILINTNFGWNNHFLKRFRMDQPEGRPKNDFEAGLAEHKAALFEGFKRMVPAVAEALPDFTIVVRPHPTEDHDLWREVGAQHDNLKVVGDGNVVPWLIACEALVHVGCTTGVEAAVLGTPAVAYQPVQSSDFDDHLPNDVSHATTTLPELTEALQSILEGKWGTLCEVDRRRLLESHIAALDGPLAADRMIRVLEEMGYPAQPPPAAGLARQIRGRLANRIRTAQKQINMRRSDHRNSIEFHDHRFPRIGLEDLRERMHRLQRLLGRFDDVRVEQISEHIFRLDR